MDSIADLDLAAPSPSPAGGPLAAALADARLGAPARHRNLLVFPLLARGAGRARD